MITHTAQLWQPDWAHSWDATYHIQPGWVDGTIYAEDVKLVEWMHGDERKTKADAVELYGADWIEELVLRMWGPDVYDQWTSHKIPFNDERIVAAFEEMDKLLLTDGASWGGSRGILATAFGDAMNPAFETPAKCYWMRQGNFISGFFPTTIQSNLDAEVGTTVFPPYEGGFAGQPILGGGDIAALFNGDDPDAIEVMKFLTSDQFGAEWAQMGGWLSPHKTFDAANYPDETTRSIAEMAANADVFRYDGSDLMPNAVGGGSFWSGMVDFTSGAKTAQQVADDIEKSWPQ